MTFPMGMQISPKTEKFSLTRGETVPALGKY